MADTIVVEYGVKHDILGLRPMTGRLQFSSRTHETVLYGADEAVLGSRRCEGADSLETVLRSTPVLDFDLYRVYLRPENAPRAGMAQGTLLSPLLPPTVPKAPSLPILEASVPLPHKAVVGAGAHPASMVHLLAQPSAQPQQQQHHLQHQPQLQQQQQQQHQMHSQRAFQQQPQPYQRAQAPSAAQSAASLVVSNSTAASALSGLMSLAEATKRPRAAAGSQPAAPSGQPPKRSKSSPSGDAEEEESGDDSPTSRRSSQIHSVTLLHLMLPRPDGSPAPIAAGTPLVILRKQRGPQSHIPPAEGDPPFLGEAVVTHSGAIKDLQDGRIYETPTEWYRKVSGAKNRSGWKLVRLKNDLSRNLRSVKEAYVRSLKKSGL